MIATPNTIFSNTYLDPNQWFDLPFEKGVTTPTICDPTLEKYQRLPVFFARTCFHIATRVDELVSHMFIAMSMLAEQAHQYCQTTWLGQSSTSSTILHPLVIAAANESVCENHIFAEPVIKHLYQKVFDDSSKISAIFHDATKAPQDKFFATASIATEWTFLITQIVLTQLASTAAFIAECIQDVDQALLAPDTTTPAYQRAYIAFNTAREQQNKKTPSTGGSSSWSSSWVGGSWFSFTPPNPFNPTTTPTPINTLPTFSADATHVEAAAIIDYETIKTDSDALRTWLKSARNYILANQDHMVPVKLQNHDNLCYYDTAFQTYVHQMIMHGSFLNDNDVSNTMWAGLFDDALIDLAIFRTDLVRYMMGLVKGIETGGEQAIRLDGQVPGIHFGRQWDILDVMRAMSTGLESQFDHVVAGDPKPLGKVPLGIGIRPAVLGNEDVTYTQLQVNQWLTTSEGKYLISKEKGLNLLRDWVRANENANIIINYRNVALDLQNNDNNEPLLKAIEVDKARPNRYSESHFSFTYENLPDLANPTANEEAVDVIPCHSFEHPLIQSSDLNFEEAVAHSITTPYTHENHTFLKYIPDAERQNALNTANTLEDLNPLFMQRIYPTHAECLDRNNWNFEHESHALFRIQVERNNHTLLPADKVAKPKLTFELYGKRFDFVSCSFHTGSLRGGHWTAIRREGDTYWKINDCGGNTQMTKQAVETLLNNNGPAGQIREVIYGVSYPTDPNPQDLFGDSW